MVHYVYGKISYCLKLFPLSFPSSPNAVIGDPARLYPGFLLKTDRKPLTLKCYELPSARDDGQYETHCFYESDALEL